MLKVDQKVCAQRRLISTSNEGGNNKGHAADDADEVELKNLRAR